MEDTLRIELGNESEGEFKSMEWGLINTLYLRSVEIVKEY